MTTSPGWSRLLLAALALGAATPGSACTPSPWTGSRDAKYLTFLGLARADTLLAGKGPVRPIVEMGHFGRGTSRAVYGQRFAIERLGAPWRSLVPPGTKTLILVPWDFDASCRPVYWTRSAVWVEPSMRALYQGTLRPKSQWVNGEPTLDVQMPRTYTGVVHPRSRADSAMRWLTPDEYLDLVEVLPRSDSLEIDPIRATAALNLWAEAHPDIATANPARDMIWTARYFVDNQRKARQIVPIAGTFKVEVRLPWGEKASYFSRSELHGTGSNPGQRHKSDGLGEGLPPFLDCVLTIHALGEDVFDKRADSGDPVEQGYQAVSLDPVIRTRDSTVWRGRIDALQVLMHLERDSTRKARLKELLTRSEKERTGEWWWGPGFWTLKPGMPMRFASSVYNDKEVFYTITATQVSHRALRP